MMTQVQQETFVTPKRVTPTSTGFRTLSLRKRGNGGWSEVRMRLSAPRLSKLTAEQRLRHQLICAPV